MIKYTFSSEINKSFSDQLKSRVNGFFRSNQLSKNADNQMVVKCIVLLLVYITPFAIVVSGSITSIPVLFGLWIWMGMAQAFMGTAVMHDVLHGSFSKNKMVNGLMSISALVIGVYPEMWRIQHNVLHHTYTNIEHADEDIESRFVLRFSPFQPRRWFHRFQYLYAPIFYSLTTLIWVTVKDFVKLIMYRKKGLITSTPVFIRHLAAIILLRIVYWGTLLGLPIFVLGISPWIILLMFITMHAVSGLMLSLIFQTAHVMTTSEYVMQEENKIEENWSVHQLLTTSNYAMNNKLLSWLFGGLNFQIEHHLFPHVCHVHYPKISKIVQETAREHNLPYNAQPTFRKALQNHFEMLKMLGRQDSPPVQKVAVVQ